MNTPITPRAVAFIFFVIATAIMPRAMGQGGVSSPAVEFNGSNSYMTISSFSQSFRFTNALTVEAWVKPRSMKCNTIFCNGSGYTTNTSFILMVGWGGGACGDAMKIAFWGAGAWDYSTGTIPTNAWSHVAVVFDGVNKYFYINGVLDRTAPRSGVITNYGTVPTIGQQGYGNPLFSCACNTFDGQIDELRIWRANRTAVEISANMGRELVISAQTNLFANYRFDEGAGLSSVDSSGTNGAASIGNAVLWVLGSSPVPYLGPLVTATTATNIGVTNATLQSVINPNAQATTAWFEWGTTTNFGNVTAPQSLGSGTNFLLVTQTLSNLTANQTYFFRAVASNASFSNVSSNRSFTPSLFSDIALPTVGVYQGDGAWADYDNDGLLDFFYAGTVASGNFPAKLYHNNGNGTFTENTATTFLAARSVAWGDFDNDGWADLLLGGSSVQLYRNNHDGTFTSVAGMPPLQNGVAQWMDYDSDGHVDILLSGTYAAGVNTARVYRNNGNGTFSYVDVAIPFSFQQFASAVAWGDVDNDGFPDVFVSGQPSIGSPYVSSVYRNNRNGTFSDMNAALPGMYAGAVRFTDFNNDGFNDLLLSGTTPSSINSNRMWFGSGTAVFANAGLTFSNITAVSAADFDNDGRTDLALATSESSQVTITHLVRNVSPGVLAEMGIALPNASLSSIDAGDFDNDGRLDLLITGLNGNDTFSSPKLAAVFHNNMSIAPNTPPSAPGGLVAIPTGTGVWLSWNAASDAQTPTAALTYNVRVGTTPGGNEIVSALSAPNGFRRIPRAGNSGFRRMMFVPNLVSGTTYYWSVQAVDQSFAGSAFAPEQNFLQQTPIVTTGGATNVTFNSASVIGAVNPNGLSAGAWFEFGTTTNYGSSTAPVSLGNGSAPISFSSVASGLTKFTVYHYRLVATNTSGITYGVDQTFQSQFLAPSPVQITRNLLPGQNTTRVLYLTNLNASVVSLTNTVSPAAAWVRPYVDTLAIGANAVGQVLLTFDATGLGNGTNYSTLFVSSGAGLPTLPVPLTLVVGAPGILIGDVNGDGVVDDAEFASVLSSYYQSAPPTISSVTSPSGTTFSFGLSNLNSLSPTVLATTNVALPLNQWQSIGPATLFYRITDPTATNYPQRFYELRFP